MINRTMSTAGRLMMPTGGAEAPPPPVTDNVVSAQGPGVSLTARAGTMVRKVARFRGTAPAGATVTVERFDDLAQAARLNLASAGYDRVDVVVGDGSQGYEQRAPYDAIIVAAAFPTVPEVLGQQLRHGGRLVQPLGPGGSESVTLFRATAEGLQRIRPVIDAGQRVFGENRVQEAQGKWPELKRETSGIELHLIGPLQSNKAADAVALFDVIETIDRGKIARAVAAEMERQGRKLRFYVQVNTGLEPQKAGIVPEETVAFVDFCRAAHRHC